MNTVRADSASGPKANTDGVYLHLSAVVVLLSLGAGCAELHWQKSGGNPATLDEDLQECALGARLQARQRELPRLDSPLTIRADPQGRPVVMPNTTRDSDRFLMERDLTAACMRGKGYVLAPDRR